MRLACKTSSLLLFPRLYQDSAGSLGGGPGLDFQTWESIKAHASDQRAAAPPQVVRSDFFDLGPGVFEGEGAVEDQIARSGVGIEAEVADALELEAVLQLGVGERGLQLGAGEDLQRVGVEIVEDVLAFGKIVGIGLGEELVVETDFGGDGVGGRDPVHGGLDLAAVGRVAAAAGRIVGAVHLDDVAGRVFHHALGGDEVGVAQAHLLAGREAVVLGRRNLAEVVLLDINRSLEKGTWRVPAGGSSGLLATSTNSSWPAG